MERLRRGEKPMVQRLLRSRVGRFATAEDGSLIIFGLFLLILMLGAGGLGVDFMRYEAERTRLQATLDRAVLAAARMEQELDPKTVVLDYFDKAGLGAHISADDITIQTSATAREVQAVASMEIDTMLLRFLGINELSTPASGGAAEAASETEISLILDVSGSMSWSSASGRTKIYELQRAATQFVNMVLCNPADPSTSTNCTVEEGKVSITMVPYSEQVSAGSFLLGHFNASTEHTRSSCVNFDADDFSETAITPEQALERTGHFDPWSRSRDNARRWVCPTSRDYDIMALEGDADELRKRINRLRAYGNTSIDLAMKWGTAFLDPAAQPVVEELVDRRWVSDDFDGRPYPWDERGVEKVVVLMTDGVNTDQHYLYDGMRSGLSPVWVNLVEKNGNLVHGGRYSIYDEDNDRYYWENQRRWDDHAFGSGTYEQCRWRWTSSTGWYQDCVEVPEGEGAEQLTWVELWSKKPWAWYDRWSWLPDQGSDYGNSTKNSRLQAICTAAKAQNIKVFTIGFEVTDASSAVLRTCSSGDAFHYDVDGLDLTNAFAAIAREIAKLRLIN